MVMANLSCVTRFCKSLTALLTVLVKNLGGTESFLAILPFQPLDIQALSNMVWSFATIMGEECLTSPTIRSLFIEIRHEAIVR